MKAVSRAAILLAGFACLHGCASDRDPAPADAPATRSSVMAFGAVEVRSLSPERSATGAVEVRPLPPEDSADAPAAALFRQLDQTFGRGGEVTAGVYRLITPRADLFVTVDGMDVPTGAFLESDFRFWYCPCGKLLVNGQFVVADYEANDVVDELHVGHLEVASIAPLLLHEKPRLLLVRFQGEGKARHLAKTLKSALSYTGEARNAPLPMNLSP